MVYDWDGKEAECYRLYVEERRSLDEVMEFWKQRDFAPSKRAFQTQFKRWDFPSKQNPAHKNPALVARVKELWEKNTNQRDMLQILNDEGFEIRERELMRVRAKNRWLLRVPNGMKGATTTAAIAQTSETYPESFVNELRQAIDQEDAGPPRFPSETTIDESKSYLNLDNELYRQLRDQFQTICEEESVIKKTLAGPDKWQQVKDRLIAENEHLQAQFTDEQMEKPDQKMLSLDVICTDVTKRMRTMERRMTIAEAKNIIGVNPAESRQIRDEFYEILKADHITRSAILQRILAPGDTDPQHQQRLKALEVLCRDVMKRLRDDQTKRDPSRKKQINTGPGTMEELQALATKAHPDSSVVRIEGVVKGKDFKEVNYPIDDNEELGGYLAHMSAGKVTFAVQLA
ncbi:putative glutamyl-trna amidotransferase subunit a protein [Neofusicoccum parvum UCRNP2]|uniref:Putative glutamyl-trna amidotransferase subunit a protein n=1 Tax=Botryosphaeria parva (strain UCR-NP2) TaxID=1287680 RepID=R1GHS7_BOTPV|nr:putative glutamyl-trna amidotransferase subunit a protein [Neofusicoccum parvum UCRNP2]